MTIKDRGPAAHIINYTVGDPFGVLVLRAGSVAERTDLAVNALIIDGGYEPAEAHMLIENATPERGYWRKVPIPGESGAFTVHEARGLDRRGATRGDMLRF